MTFTEIIARLYSNKYLRRLRKLIESGKGTFADTFNYTDKSADLLGNLFSECVLDMQDKDRITSCVELLRDRHKDINGLLDITQRSLDKKLRLNIAPQHVPFNEERAKQIGISLTDKAVPESTVQRRAKSATANATRAVHDDYIEANAEFRSKAGLQCYITRTTDGSCCKWCTQMAGRYEYGSEPKGIYRRHDNCGCAVTYENGRQRQNVWTKKTWEVPADDAGAPPPAVFTQEQAAAAGAPPPKSFTKEEAQELNSANVKKNSAKPDDVHNSSIDNSEINDIILLREDDSNYYSISDEVIKNAPDLQPFSPEFDDEKDYTNEEAEKIFEKAQEMNKRYRDACQATLYYAKNFPPGTECSFVLNNELNPIDSFTVVVGTKGSVALDDPDEYYHAFHNHGSGETFSFKDLGAIADRQRMCSLTAVGNNGSCYNIIKMPDYDSDGLKVLLNEKGDDIIYRVGDKEISLSYLSDNDKKQEVDKLIDNLGEKQKEELKQAIKNKIIECIEEGENYGIKYSSS